MHTYGMPEEELAAFEAELGVARAPAEAAIAGLA